MKFIAAALLALLSLAAHAQVEIPLMSCITDRPDWAIPTAKRPALPQQLGGPCGPAIIEANAKGASAAWWCAQPSPNPPTLTVYAVRWSAVTPAMLLDYAQLGLPGDNAERIRAMQTKYQTANVWDMCDVFGPAIARINAAMPPVTVWRVAPNGTYADRPSYAVTGGVRATVSKTRAAVGAACNCAAIKLTEGSSNYCQTAPSFVALCRAAP